MNFRLLFEYLYAIDANSTHIYYYFKSGKWHCTHITPKNVKWVIYCNKGNKSICHIVYDNLHNPFAISKYSIDKNNHKTIGYLDGKESTAFYKTALRFSFPCSKVNVASDNNGVKLIVDNSYYRLRKNGISNFFYDYSFSL